MASSKSIQRGVFSDIAGVKGALNVRPNRPNRDDEETHESIIYGPLSIGFPGCMSRVPGVEHTNKLNIGQTSENSRIYRFEFSADDNVLGDVETHVSY